MDILLILIIVLLVIQLGYVVFKVNEHFWNRSVAPWSNCLGESASGCVSRETRLPGWFWTGSTAMLKYPACGFSCTQDSDCAEDCPKCVRGRCE